ncbi:MBOAT family protein [Candidatus Poribacteria bacterium]|nr:MBOAT family protein [Candidatus Poribacteria bacterium]
MLFNSVRYVAFFIVVYVAYWLLVRTKTPRILLLLAASYFFYGSWNAWFLGLILASTVIDYMAALAIDAAHTSRGRTAALVISLAANLGLLFTFKYLGFAATSAQAASDRLGLGWSIAVPDLILPVGISFYTFQSLSYTIDVYRREVEPTRSFWKFALFVAFFPQLVAGPIVRAKDFLPQLSARADLDADLRLRGLWFCLIGFTKKIVIADYLAINLADRVFSAPEQYTGTETLMGIYAYAAQIYCDFSGYSDIAIGSAMLLGFHLPTNFDRPYAASNLQDFWRRWHITLSTWLRDYLYIPLGGSRKGNARTYANLAIVMLLGGLWHGAAWTFVVWGALHGGALATTRAWQRARGAKPLTGWRRGVGIVLTFHFVCLGWVVFRAPTFGSVVEVLSRLVYGGAGLANVPLTAYALLILVAAGNGMRSSWVNRLREGFVRLPAPAQAAALVAATLLVYRFHSTDVVPFIYFQF